MTSVTRSRFQLLYGRDEAPAQPRALRAGALDVELHGPDLRYARTAANEVVRRIYVAARDLNWNTLPVAVGEPEIEKGDGEFRVRFDARCAEGDIDFRWTGTVVGTRDGAISYELDGRAERAFAFAKIGICIHHPMRETAGRLFRGAAPSTPVGGELPRFVGPQIHVPEEGWDLPLFEPAEWFGIDMPHGERVRFDFEGDLFEMEDQRNWTDGSFKTASTPASLGYHHTLEAGRRIRQKVTFRVDGSAPTRTRTRRSGNLTVRVGGPLAGALPPIGLGAASHGEPLSAREAEALRRLGPAHLRVDVRPGELDALRSGVRTAQDLGGALEVALFAGGDSEFVEEVAATLDGVPVARVLVFDDGAEATPIEAVELARSRLGGHVVGGGTNVYFNELNRTRPDPERLDVVAYSVNPQIHAFDELSLVESLEAQGETVRSARAFCGATPIAVTPITLRPRFNAVATVEEAEESGGLPRQVDPRQMSLFAAAWTVGSVKHLAEAGAASLTYFETTGWRGVMEREGAAAVAAFPSVPGEPFPVYHVLADLCAWRDRMLREAASSDPLAVTALAVEGGVLVANLRATPANVRMEGMAGPARLVRCNDGTAPQRRQERADDVSGLALEPFEVVRIDT